MFEMVKIIGVLSSGERKEHIFIKVAKSRGVYHGFFYFLK